MQSREIFGAEIQYFRLDPRYWERILGQFEDAGLRCVTTYVQWATHLVGPPDKKHPAGVLDFEGRTNPRLNLFRFLELVEKHGLDLNFRCGPFCCNEMIHGAYPPWLVLGGPNLMVWDWQNRTTQGYWIGKKEGSQPSYLHPTYLDWCCKWLDEADRIIVPHLKANGGCVTMVNLDNEISYIVRDGFLDSDYNPVNVRPGGHYHRFLARKYGSARRLPYPKRYRAIEDVPAPRAVPETIGDVAILYDLIQHQHTSIGDPTPCADNDLHISRPTIDGVPAGKATAEYEGLFRLVEQAGVQPHVVDIMHSDARLRDYPLAFLPGSPVIERAALERLENHVHRGGRLVLSGPIPQRDERGRRIRFLKRNQFLWHRGYLAQEKPEEEKLESIQYVASLVQKHVSRPHVRLSLPEEVTWTDWQEGGGHRLYRQPRNLGSAVLHQGNGETVLFVLNHYPEAARFEVRLGDPKFQRLTDLSTDEVTPLRRGRAVLDLDRKSAELYAVG